MRPERDPPARPDPPGVATARGGEAGAAAGFTAVSCHPSPLAALLREVLAPRGRGEDAETAEAAADLPRLERRSSRRPSDAGAATELLMTAMQVARARVASGEADGAVAATRLAADAARLLRSRPELGPETAAQLGLPDGLAGGHGRRSGDPPEDGADGGDLRGMASVLDALGRASAADPSLEIAHAAAAVLLGLAQAEGGSVAEARATLEGALARLGGGGGDPPPAPGGSALRAHALRAHALVCDRAGDRPAALASLRRARDVARELAAKEGLGPWRGFLVEGMVAELSMGAVEAHRLDALLTDATSLVAAAPGAFQSLEVGMLLALHGLARGGIGDRCRAVEALGQARPLLASWHPDSSVEKEVREVYLRGIDDAIASFA